MRLFISCMLLPLCMVGCLAENHEPTKDVYSGENAKSRILQQSKIQNGDAKNEDGLPNSARNFFYNEGGSFNGSIIYWSFDCGSREDCLKAFEYSSGLDRSKLAPFKHSQYAIVMEGPGFYNERLKTNLWNVSRIKNGVAYEMVQGGDRRMVYYAIDFDRNRIYHHYESGGFPAHKYVPGR